MSVRMSDKGGSSAPLNLTSTTTSMVPLTIKRDAGQTNSLILFQDENGAYLADIASNALLNTPSILCWGRIATGLSGYIGNPGYPGLTPQAITHGTQHTQNIWAWNTTDVPLSISGTAGQTGNLQEWIDSSQNVLAKVDAGGNIVTSNNSAVSCGNFILQNNTGISWNGSNIYRNGTNGAITVGMQNFAGASFIVQSGNAASTPLITQGAAGQTADLQQWQDSTGAVLANIASNGGLILSGAGGIVVSSGNVVLPNGGIGWANQSFLSRNGTTGALLWSLQNISTGSLTIAAGNAAANPLIVQGTTSQTADLLQLQSSTSATLAKVDATGKLSCNNVSSPGLPTPSDIGLITWTVPPLFAQSTHAPVTGQLYLHRVRIPPGGASITNFVSDISTGGTTLTNCYLGLYNLAGTLVASTANQSATWTGTGVFTTPITGGPYAAAGGDYYIALLVGGGTAPNWYYVSGSSAAASMVNLNTTWCGTYGSALSALPATITPASIAAGTILFWLGLS